jgi:hypothetical protein
MRTVRLSGLFGFFLLVIISWISLPLTASIRPTLASVQNPPGPAGILHSDSKGGMQIQPAEGSWKWGLRLVRYGSIELTGQPRRVWAENNRVYYRWDGSLTEWVENGERGLEQGFTVKKRPPGLENGQPLALILATQGGLSPVVAAGVSEGWSSCRSRPHCERQPPLN